MELGQLARSAVTEFATSNLSAVHAEQFARTRIELLTKPHRPSGLPSGRMAVYCFFFSDRALKIGIAGPNSDARYRSQHYNPGSAQSTLAKSILTYPERIGIRKLEEAAVGRWIKEHTDRINLLIPATLDRGILTYFEAFLHNRWAPVYEGRQT